MGIEQNTVADQSPDETPVSLADVRRDIEQLRRSWEVLSIESLVLQCVPAFVADVNSRIIRYATASASKLFGYVPGELVGKPINLLIPSSLWTLHDGHVDAYLRNPWSRVMGDYETQPIGQHKDGHELFLEIGLEPTIRDGNLCAVLTMVETRKPRIA